LPYGPSAAQFAECQIIPVPFNKVKSRVSGRLAEVLVKHAAQTISAQYWSGLRGLPAAEACAAPGLGVAGLPRSLLGEDDLGREAFDLMSRGKVPCRIGDPGGLPPSPTQHHVGSPIYIRATSEVRVATRAGRGFLSQIWRLCLSSKAFSCSCRAGRDRCTVESKSGLEAVSLFCGGKKVHACVRHLRETE